MVENKNIERRFKQLLNHRGRTTDINREIRLNHLMILVSSLKTQGRKISQAELAKEVEKRTGVKISPQQISLDLVELRNQNTFVKDIATQNYSRMAENDYLTYMRIQKEAWENYNKVWTANKTVRREIPTEDGVIEVEETTETSEIATGKATFLRIYLDATKALEALRDGRACDLSVVLMGNKYQQMETENDIMKKRLESYASQ